jgi:hypothetical protein
MGVPGCPLLAACTPSILSVRMVFIANDLRLIVSVLIRVYHKEIERPAVGGERAKNRLVWPATSSQKPAKRHAKQPPKIARATAIDNVRAQRRSEKTV